MRKWEKTLVILVPVVIVVLFFTGVFAFAKHLESNDKEKCEQIASLAKATDWKVYNGSCKVIVDGKVKDL